MKRTTRLNRRVEWGRTHLTCPCPRREKRCFSEFKDADGQFGKCFACNELITPRRGDSKCQSAKVPRVLRGTLLNKCDDVKFIPEKIVEDSCVYFHRSCLNVGIDAECSARADAVAANVQSTSPFAAFITRMTGNSMCAAHWCIGLDERGYTLFWLRDKDNRAVNAKVIAFDKTGEHRVQHIPPHYLFVRRDGYSCDCLFGEHQLNRDYVHWNRRRFNTDATVV